MSPSSPDDTSEAQTDSSAHPAKRAPGFWRFERARRPSRWHVTNAFVIAVCVLSVVGTLIVLPRPTYPQILPLPDIDRARESARESEELKRALSVKDGSLDKHARAVGEQVRRIGLELSLGNPVQPADVTTLRTDAAALLGRDKEGTLPAGEEALLNLRALQSQLFLVAVKKWVETGEVSTELRELGGPFHQLAATSWFSSDRTPLLTENDLRLFFRVHWGKLVGLHKKHPFEPSLEELRRYYSANLQHPVGQPGDMMTTTSNQITFAQALGRVDSSYPGALAVGILQLRLGQSLLAMNSLRAHLDQNPDGPWTQLARNHLILATRQTDTIAHVDP